MGRPKALLPYRGGTLLSHLCSTLLAADLSPVIVVVGAFAEEVATALPPSPRLRSVVNPTPAAGPLSSLVVGLSHIPKESDGCLLAPVDHPAVRPETVRRLLAVFAETGGPIVLPVYQGKRGHPVLFARALFPELQSAPPSEGARAVVRADPRRVREVTVEDPGVLLNVDTPADYERLLHLP